MNCVYGLMYNIFRYIVQTKNLRKASLPFINPEKLMPTSKKGVPSSALSNLSMLPPGSLYRSAVYCS